MDGFANSHADGMDLLFCDAFNLANDLALPVPWGDAMTWEVRQVEFLENKFFEEAGFQLINIDSSELGRIVVQMLRFTGVFLVTGAARLLGA